MLEPHRDKLSEVSLQRLQAKHAVRILDSKSPQDREVVAQLSNLLPSIDDFATLEDRDHFLTLQEMLADSGVNFSHNPRLVRGLDYYSGTCFEVKLEHDGGLVNHGFSDVLGES